QGQGERRRGVRRTARGLRRVPAGHLTNCDADDTASIALCAVKHLTATLAGFFLIAPAAHADLSVTTSTTQAGAPAQVSIDATFTTPPSSVTLHLPPGLVGNPKSADRCPPVQFENL